MTTHNTSCVDLMVLWLATTTPRTRLATLKRHTLQSLSILELLSSHSRDLSSFSWCTARFAPFFLARPCSCGHSFCRYQLNKRLGSRHTVLSPPRPPDSFDAECCMLLALLCGRPPSFALSCVCPRLLVRARPVLVRLLPAGVSAVGVSAVGAGHAGASAQVRHAVRGAV